MRDYLVKRYNKLALGINSFCMRLYSNLANIQNHVEITYYYKSISLNSLTSPFNSIIINFINYDFVKSAWLEWHYNKIRFIRFKNN